MTPSKLSYKFALAFLTLFSVVFFTSCQYILGGLDGSFDPTLSPTSSITLTPTIRATFTHLPGDIYFLYQTQTAAPSTYPLIHWQTSTPTTPTPIYTLTAIALASTKSVCLLAYPDFCISPDIRLGCTALRGQGKQDFTVLPPDPYGYDKDGDGIGCEIGE